MEYACTKTQSLSFAWRFPLGFQIVLLLAIIVLVNFYPESSRRLEKTGRFEEAHDFLERCRVRPDTVMLDQEFEEIINATRLEHRAASITFADMILKDDEPKTRKRVPLGCGMQVTQKLTGIDFISTNAPEMFSLAGFSGDKATILAGDNFFGYTASLALAIWLADKVGRRKLMLAGCTILGIVLKVGGVLSHETIRTANNEEGKAQQYGAGVAAVLSVYSAVCGSLTVAWIYRVEVFPLATRARGTSLAPVGFFDCRRSRQ